MLGLVAVLQSSEYDFESLIAECGSEEPSRDCLRHIHEIAEDENNPLHSYLNDLLDDQEKYCGCNKVVTDTLPICHFTMLGPSMSQDLNYVHFGSCLFEELCEEFHGATCELLNTHVEECIESSKAEAGNVAHCQGGCETLAHEECLEGEDETNEQVREGAKPSEASEFTKILPPTGCSKIVAQRRVSCNASSLSASHFSLVARSVASLLIFRSGFWPVFVLTVSLTSASLRFAVNLLQRGLRLHRRYQPCDDAGCAV